MTLQQTGIRRLGPKNRFRYVGADRRAVSRTDLARIDALKIPPAWTEVAINREWTMDELNGRMIACQILITGLIARVANSSPDPLRFLTDFRDEIKAVVKGVNIAGMENTDRVRQIAHAKVDELFSLMKPPSTD